MEGTYYYHETTQETRWQPPPPPPPPPPQPQPQARFHPSTPSASQHDEQMRRRAEIARLEAEEEYSAERKRQKRRGEIAALRRMDPYP